MVDVDMKMEFSVRKYFHVYSRVGPAYGDLAKFIIIDKYVGFPGEGYNFSFTDDQFHIISSGTTLYRFMSDCSRLQLSVDLMAR
jgi:hypothetical protein